MPSPKIREALGAASPSWTDRESASSWKHCAGEFEGMYTGFIAEVFGRKTPRDAAVDALERGGLRLGREEVFVSSGEERLAERGRFRFAGWLDVPVVEHEFTLRLGDGVTLEERFPPRVHDGDADEGTRETFDPRRQTPHPPSARRRTRSARAWTASDDRAWFPTVLGLAMDEEEDHDKVDRAAFVGERWRSATSSSAITASCGNTPAWARRDGRVLHDARRQREGASDSGGYLRGRMTPR